MPYKHFYLFLGTTALALLLAAVAGCVISPRRIVAEASPTPTPTITPTPTPVLTPTPTPIVTASATVPAEASKNGAGAQFLFVSGASSGAASSEAGSMINGFKINPDGSLIPVPGSPFAMSAPVKAIASMQGTLIVAGEKSITAFAVNKETGFIQPTSSVAAEDVSSIDVDSSQNAILATTQKGSAAFGLSKGKLVLVSSASAASARQASSAPPSAVRDATGQFIYVIDASKTEIAAYRVDQGKTEPLTPPAYPLAPGASVVTLVKP
jgi:6-phosphogluconolactonase (cycloisomerase 2 family)